MTLQDKCNLYLMNLLLAKSKKNSRNDSIMQSTASNRRNAPDIRQPKQQIILLNAKDIQEKRKNNEIDYINGRQDVNPFMTETIGVESDNPNYKYCILQLGYAGNRSQKYYAVGFCN